MRNIAFFRPSGKCNCVLHAPFVSLRTIVRMDMTEKLSTWGATHAAARDAERAAQRQGGSTAERLRAEARALRERADRLHSEILRPQAEGARHG